MNPAEHLKGMTLDGGWVVVDRATRLPNATGGHFSHGYIAEHPDGRRGFLKALDYTEAMTSHDPTRTMLGLLQAYEFERTLCEKVSHLSRIARAIDRGAVVNPSNPFLRVDYLIFELADRDIRAHLDLQASLDVVFVMNAIHHVATGLKQLHIADIAHQDLKPSNVLVYPAGSKICDLGRAWDKNMAAAHDRIPIAGARAYAPPEFSYYAVPADERARRFGCDLYHLGSLLVFCFSRAHMNSLLNDNLHPLHRAGIWGGTFQDVLPYIIAAFELALTKFEGDVPDYLKAELRRVAAELCEPDPSRRGHPRNRGANQHSLERYISQFNRLAHVAMLQLVRSFV